LIGKACLDWYIDSLENDEYGGGAHVSSKSAMAEEIATNILLWACQLAGSVERHIPVS
jgi:hypothetical protein